MELGFWIPIISGISDSLSCIPVFSLLGARRRMRLIVERTLKNRFYGPKIQPKIPENWAGTSNGTVHLKVVHFDRSGYIGRSVGPKCLFPFDKIVVPNTAHL